MIYSAFKVLGQGSFGVVINFSQNSLFLYFYVTHGLIFNSILKTQPSVGGIKIHENQFS